MTGARQKLADERTRNRALLRHVVLPTVFVTVALLGGVRVGAGGGALVFVPPPLVTLVMAVMLLSLFARGGALRVGRWLSAENGTAENVSHALTLAALFLASAQAFNSALPEAGLPRFVLSSFFLWTLWQNQFSNFDPRRLLRSLAALFGTAFFVKHVLLASLSQPGEGWLGRLAASALEGVTLGTLGGPAYAAATGYVSFFALALYVCGLALLPPAPRAETRTDDADDTDDADEADSRAAELVHALRLLPERERLRVLEASRETEKEGRD
ncbi:MAG: hypothetical protein QOD42_228 [Sphingomonadales bacterium]|jgi:hypothetical protein|nr:hypothetical protein [Sphingomonadales bacterium]